MTDVVLSPDQQAIVDAFPSFLLSKDKEMTITGPAGTGKTFLVRELSRLLPAQQKIVKLLDPTIAARKFYYTATTNKAAEVLSSVVKKETHTIHSVLGLKVHNNYRTGEQELIAKGPRVPLSHTILVIDEASMINDELLRHIRKAQRVWNDCKVVYIGDEYQLPPVKEDICAVFKNAPNIHRLTQIQRQAEGSPIIQLATEWRELLDNAAESFPELRPDNKTIFGYSDKREWVRELRRQYRKPHKRDDLRIVAWSNNRVTQYNNWVRSSVLKHPDPFMVGDQVSTNNPLVGYAPTDTILTIRSVEPTTMNMKGIEVPGWSISFHGIMYNNIEHYYAFQPADWKQVSGILKALAKDKDWTNYFKIKEQWTDLRPIHANTVHKAQGSTYRKVFIDLDDIGKNTRWRDLVRLMYVAITRASDEVHIYGDVSIKHTTRTANDTLEAFDNVRHLLG